MRITFFLIFLFQFALLGCKYDLDLIPPPHICQDGYPLVFGFENQGDSTVRLIDIETRCWRANVDSSYIYYTQYESVECDPDEIIPLSDYIVHRNYNCTGLGSKKWMWLRIVQRNEDCSIIRITEWETDTADWIYMYEESDFTEFFRWPEDTVRYIKTYDWP